jgi:Flp pilus assembly protein TadB
VTPSALSLTCGVLVAASLVVIGTPRRWVRGRVERPDEVNVGAGPRRRLVAVGAGLGAVVLVGGPMGWVMGAAIGYGVHRWLDTRGSRHDQRLGTQRVLLMPLALDLMSACLVIGASQQQALALVSKTLPGSLRQDLSSVAAALALGAAPDEAWSLVDAPDLRALRAVLTRVDVSGAPAAPMLAVLAEQHRQRARAEALDASRAMGVRMAGPVALCFLPAFVLVAVVPLVISLLPVEL